MLNINQLSFWERTTYFEGIDFLIIGSGIVGCSTALHLRKKYPSAKIVVIERGILPSGASTKNAGFACFGSPTELIDDLKVSSEEQVWNTVAERWEGLIYLREIIGDQTMDLQINGSWDIITQQEELRIQEINSSLPYLNEQVQLITGESNVYAEDKASINKFGFANMLSMYQNRLEGQINTGKMMRRYLQLLSENNIFILNGIKVEELELANNQIQTNIGDIHAQHIVVTTNGFAAELLKEDVQPARAQVIVTAPIEHLKVKGTFHYDSGYYYFRNFENRILLGGGRNLDFEGETTTTMETTSLIQDRLRSLLKDVILPGESEIKIDYEWSGIMGVGKTKQPIVKKIDNNHATGVRLGGMGVAIGSGVGKQLSELF